MKADRTGLGFVFDSSSFTSGESHSNLDLAEINRLLSFFTIFLHSRAAADAIIGLKTRSSRCGSDSIIFLREKAYRIFQWICVARFHLRGARTLHLDFWVLLKVSIRETASLMALIFILLASSVSLSQRGASTGGLHCLGNIEIASERVYWKAFTHLRFVLVCKGGRQTLQSFWRAWTR